VNPALEPEADGGRVRHDDVRVKNQRVQLLGIGVDPFTPDQVASELADYVASGTPHQVVTLNLDFLKVARKHEAFHSLVREADLVVADGMPVVWASRYLGTPIPERVTGLDLIEMCVAHSQQHGSSLFFLGAAEGLAARAAQKLATRLGQYSVAGAYSPPFGTYTAAEDAKVRRMIRDANPDFLFVAFGCPRQDFWIHEHRDLGVPVSIGVGGSFDLLSGALPRAPKWMQRAGLEWAFRLTREPGRLGRRYLLEDPPIAARLLLSKFDGSPKQLEVERGPKA
jgi:N-acetylglucosaminyldiphosphoundecaprenol N-acetyl-beta-D-mannosaminyltransferase